MAAMARCDICTRAIRKADVQRRYRYWHDSLVEVTVHPDGACKPNLGHVNNMPGKAYFTITDDLAELSAQMERHRQSQEKWREAQAVATKRRDDDRAQYVCRLELETDRHGSRTCQAPGCPVTGLFTHHPPDALSVYKRRDYSGIYYCGMCGKVASRDNSGRKCHSCEDWYGCGRDCTLVAVYCRDCGTRQAV